MKKLICIALSAVICAGVFASCGQKKSGAKQVGLIQQTQHTSLDEIRTSFEAELKLLAKQEGIEVEIDYQNGQNDATIINTACQKFVSDKKDIVAAIATNAAQGAATALRESGIPLVFSAVTDPVEAQLVTNLQAPEGNITGTSDDIPVEKIFELALELTPNIKSVGMIYNLGEPNSVSVAAKAKAYLNEHNIELVESPVSTSSEVQMAIQNLLGKTDAIFVPIDNTVASAMSTVADEAMKAKKPVYVAADSMVRDGALASVGVNYTELGKETAKMVIQALKGTPIKDIPVQTMKENNVVVNKETAAAIGVDVSKYAK